MNIFSYLTGFAVLVLIVGAGYFFTAKQSDAPSDIVAEVSQNTSSNSKSSNTKTENGAVVISGQINTSEVQIDNVVIASKVIEVNYSKDGYNPNSLEIKVGDTVKWISDGAPMWTASAKHPTHEIYPEFDQKSEGNIYEFTFTKVGTWKYHNHLSANHFGSIIVK